jgi:bifunctional non-homologous end joining protein LigD
VICIFTEADYLAAILKSAFEPCIPTGGTPVPDWPEWLHEIKHDGYRLIVQRHGKRVRLFTRNGHDWSDRFPLITEAALRNRNSSSVIDGEAVCSALMGDRISTACTPASTTMRSCFTPSTFWSVTARIFEDCRSVCVKRTWPGC